MWPFFRKDALTVWEQYELQDRLVIYREIYQGKKLPRYKLARLFYVNWDKKSSLSEKMDKHNEVMSAFSNFVRENQAKTLEEVRDKVMEHHSKDDLNFNNYLLLKAEIAEEIIKECVLCENRCKVDRTKGKVGRCGVDSDAYLASAFVHLGEESPIVPSGTVFFYGCPMHCVFCQNWDISHEYILHKLQSRKVSAKDLARVYYSLAKQHVRNINLVGGDPIPNLHIIIKSLLYSEVDAPFLWNSNMYLTEQAMKLIVDIFDIWLPDFKYGNNQCAEKYSKIKNYYDVVSRNIKMIEELGSGEYIIRHLVMPGHTDCCSIAILDWISENLEKPLVNIMAQYHPDYKVLRGSYPELHRRPTHNEMFKVKSYADELGIYWKSVS